MFKILRNNKGFLRICRDAGASGGGGGADDKGGGKGGGGATTFTQEQLDHIVQERLARERGKYSDYEDLKKFRDEHQKEQDAQKQQDLVRQKKYEEAETNYKKQIEQINGVVTAKDTELNDMRVSSALSISISTQNAYMEETLALLKGSAIVENGVVKIKGKDANGLDTVMTVEEGVKNFLKQRPHLVKVAGRAGAGTAGSAGGDAGAAGQGSEDLMTLNQEYVKATTSGDRKKATELRAKITAAIKGNRNAA